MLPATAAAHGSIHPSHQVQHFLQVCGKTYCKKYIKISVLKQEVPEGLAVASIARDDPSTLPCDDPFPRAR